MDVNAYLEIRHSTRSVPYPNVMITLVLQRSAEALIAGLSGGSEPLIPKFRARVAISLYTVRGYPQSQNVRDGKRRLG